MKQNGSFRIPWGPPGPKTVIWVAPTQFWADFDKRGVKMLRTAPSIK